MILIQKDSNGNALTIQVRDLPTLHFAFKMLASMLGERVLQTYRKIYIFVKYNNLR